MCTHTSTHPQDQHLNGIRDPGHPLVRPVHTVPRGTTGLMGGASGPTEQRWHRGVAEGEKLEEVTGAGGRDLGQ